MKKIPIIPLLGLLVPVLAVVPAAFADVAADLKQAEGLYQAGQYTQAEQAYLAVIKEADPNKPADVEAAFNARRKLPSIYIVTDRLPQAQAAVVDVSTKHGQHERLPHAIHEIIEQAKASGKTLQAGQIYQTILTAHPEHPQAIWLKMGVAVANAHLGDDKAVDSVLQNIIAQYAADDRAAEALGQVAWAYRKLQQHEKARTVYQYVVSNWPTKDRAVFSQRGIVLSSLELKQQEAADKATEEIFEKFAKDRNISKIAWTIAQVYRDKRDWGRMRPLCQYVLANHPQAEDALWAQQALIFAALDEKDPNGIQAGIQQLFARFASDARMPAAVHATARKLNVLYDAQAAQLHQYILDKYPNDEYVPLAKVGLGQIKVRQGDDAGGEAIYQKVLTDYQNHPRLAEAVEIMAEGYYLQAFRGERGRLLPWEEVSPYTKAYAEKAMAKWDLAIREIPPHPRVTPTAIYSVAAVYYQLRDYAKAEQYFTTITSQWPGSEHAWEALFLRAKMYKNMIHEGTISADDGRAKMEAAFQQLVEKYPTCPGAEAARRWLNQYDAMFKGGEK